MGEFVSCGVICENWYALFVTTGQEDNVKERVLYRFKDNLRVIVPKRSLRERKNGAWHNIIRTLFPGYVLLAGNLDVTDYYNLKNIPGLINLLKSGYDPLKINQKEIEVLSRLIQNDEIIRFSTILEENGSVIVTDGPLKDLQGYIHSIDKRKGRAKVILEFLGELRTVELGVSVLQSV